MSERTVFEKIWDDELPSHILYRSDKHGLLAMLDIHPATPGHTLVIPREAVDQWMDLPDARILQATLLGTFVSRYLQNTLAPERVTRHTIGFGVPHAHDQYVPSYVRGDTAWLYNPERIAGDVDHSALATMRKRLVFPGGVARYVDTKLDDLTQRLS